MYKRQLWDRALLARLRTMEEPDLAALPDISEGLENRLYRASRTAKSPEALLADAKTCLLYTSAISHYNLMGRGTAIGRGGIPPIGE